MKEICYANISTWRKKEVTTTLDQPKNASFSSNPNITSRGKSQLLWSEGQNFPYIWQTEFYH